MYKKHHPNRGSSSIIGTSMYSQCVLLSLQIRMLVLISHPLLSHLYLIGSCSKSMTIHELNPVETKMARKKFFIGTPI